MTSEAKILRNAFTSSVLAVLLVGCTSAKDMSSLEAMEHVHSVSTDGVNTYVASHHGLFTWENEEWKLRGPEFDVMGLSFDEEVFYASGHPGPEQGLPDPVGLLVSSDYGKTWDTRSLTGEVDFHFLEVVGNKMVGVSSAEGKILSSNDAGFTWQESQFPAITDLSINPTNSEQIMIISNGSLYFSNDSGNQFKEISVSSSLKFVEWFESGIFVATTSELLYSSAPDSAFISLRSDFEDMSDISAKNDMVVLMDFAGIHVSKDRGKTFQRLAQ